MTECFVMMPYGKRKVQLRGGQEPRDIDFDEIFDQMIVPGIKGAGLRPHRADHIFMTGSISKAMFESIFDFEAAIADISIPNPNVFYELGVRHALCKHCTLLIRNADAHPMSEGGQAPFDLTDVRFIAYRYESNGLHKGAESITAFLKTSMEGKRVDSPVHSCLPHLSVSRRESSLLHGESTKYTFRLKDRDAVIGVIAGQLQKVEDVDVWVNSENTQFEMARVFESSISSTIRYLGSSKVMHDGIEVLGDEIYKELKRCKAKLVGQKTLVKNATVVLTRPYELAHSPYHVKRIAHVASVTGVAMRGFQPVSDRRECVRNVLDAISSHNARWRSNKLRSVIFPLLGAGQARANRPLVVQELLSAAIEYLDEKPDTWLTDVYFLAATDSDRDLLLKELRKYPELSERVPSDSTAVPVSAPHVQGQK
jgi:hypothetical protein